MLKLLSADNLFFNQSRENKLKRKIFDKVYMSLALSYKISLLKTALTEINKVISPLALNIK